MTTCQSGSLAVTYQTNTIGYYASTGRRKAVPLTPELRALTLETIAAVRALLRTRQRPEVGYSARCKGCSVHEICLPHETALLRQRE
jgi:CRISPR-associated exonuclease Cas4